MHVVGQSQKHADVTELGLYLPRKIKALFTERGMSSAADKIERLRSRGHAAIFIENIVREHGVRKRL